MFGTSSVVEVTDIVEWDNLRWCSSLLEYVSDEVLFKESVEKVEQIRFEDHNHVRRIVPQSQRSYDLGIFMKWV